MTAEGLAGRSSPGRITAVDSVVDEATRNVQVQATLANPDGQPAPGHVRRDARSCWATSDAGRGAARLGDQLRALRRLGLRRRPTLKGPKGKTYKGVRQQFVKLGGARGDQVAVLSGLEAGRGGGDAPGPSSCATAPPCRSTTRSSPRNDPAPKPEDN